MMLESVGIVLMVCGAGNMLCRVLELYLTDACLHIFNL